MPKYYYYYPAYDKKYHRRLVAGLVTETQLIIAESICFPGRKGDPDFKAKVALLDEMVRRGTITPAEANAYFPDAGLKPDQFVKKKGRMIAENRALKAFNEPGKGHETMIVDIPQDAKLVGKIFLEAVEKHYPKKEFKKRKQKRLEEVVQAD